MLCFNILLLYLVLLTVLRPFIKKSSLDAQISTDFGGQHNLDAQLNVYEVITCSRTLHREMNCRSGSVRPRSADACIFQPRGRIWRASCGSFLLSENHDLNAYDESLSMAALTPSSPAKFRWA